MDPAIIREGESYLGDAVYVRFDGWNIWLRTGDGNDNEIALEPDVYERLLEYVERLKAKAREQKDALKESC